MIAFEGENSCEHRFNWIFYTGESKGNMTAFMAEYKPLIWSSSLGTIYPCR